MTRRTLFAAAILTAVTAALALELWAVIGRSPNTVTITELVVQFVPAAVTTAAVGWLVHWLPGHFQHAYQTTGGGQMSRYAKFIIAALGAAATAAIPLLSDGNISGQEGVMIAAAALAAVGVLLVPNKPAPDPNAVRPLSGPPRGY